MKVLFKKDNYRIIEIFDDNYDEYNFNSQEYNLAISKGVWGYELQKWNPEVDKGWEHVDSCYGFIGNFKEENHYIVDEFKQQIYNNTKKLYNLLYKHW